MNDLFKKLNTLVRAQIDGFIEDDLRLPRQRRRSDKPFDPASKEAGQVIADLRQQIENALRYEDELGEQIDALHQEASDLDHQSNVLLQAGEEENTRRTLEQLQRTERQIAMLEADLSRHRQQTAALMDRVNVMESMAGAAQAAERTAPKPMPESSTPSTANPEVNIPVTITVETDQPPEQRDSGVKSESPVQDDVLYSPPPADDDNLAARRARLTQRPPKPTRGVAYMCAYILTVDDESQMRLMLSDALTSNSYEVEQASSAKEALLKLESRRPDLLVLDVGMPEMDGLTLCKKLRDKPEYITLPILFLTAYSQPEDIVKGLDAGADDYTTKPINLPIFLARVRALLRRGNGDGEEPTNNVQDQSKLTVGGLTLNSDTYQVDLEEKTIQLTATEHRLLRYMIEYKNQPLSPQRLLEAVWEYPPYTGDPDLVRVHIRNLRTKLNEKTRQAKYLQTVHGVGYMIQSDEKP